MRRELKISGGTSLERIMVREYLFSHLYRVTALEVNCDWIVSCYIEDLEDEDEFYEINQYLNCLSAACHSTLKVEEIRS